MTLGNPGSSIPDNWRKQGRTKRWSVTSAEAGLPGREKMRQLLGSPMSVLKGMVAKVVGFPGFIDTRPKWIVPPKDRSMVGFRRSSSPMETPPVVTMTSTLRTASRRLDSNAFDLWKKFPFRF